MNWPSVSFDWNQARAFLATAEEGSLSAAARALGHTQPTLSRQVAALEQDLGVTLFERVGRSLALTDAGRELLDHCRAMGEAAGRVSLTAAGQAQAVEGHVNITATNWMATYHLPPVLARLRDVAPGISVTVIASNEVRDLRRREADIAIRHGRPEEPELIAKLIGEVAAHLYAAPAYFDHYGRPETVADLADATFVGFEHPERLLPLFESLGVTLTPRHFMLTSASGTVILALVERGLGIAPLTADIAALWPDLERVLPDLELARVPTWLVAHRELHTSRRIRLVFDLLADHLTPGS